MTTATMTTKTTFPKTLALGEEIYLGEGREMRVKRIESDRDGEIAKVYELAEWVGEGWNEWSFVAEHHAIREAVRDGYGMINGGLESAITMTFDDHRDQTAYDDDAIEALMSRVGKLGDSRRPAAEMELRKILAEVKAAIGA